MTGERDTEPAREFVPRRRLCLECRSALPHGEPCSWMTHSVVDMDHPAGWESLQARVWGAMSRRDIIMPPTALILAFVALFVACAGAAIGFAVSFLTTSNVRGVFIICALIVGAPMAAAYSLLRFLYQKNRIVREHDRPRGAATEPLPPQGGMVLSGRIEAAAAALSPLSREPCVGFAIELERTDASGSPVMLRDSASLGFSVVEDGGRTIRIQPGALVLVGPRDEVRDRGDVAAYLKALAPPPAGAGEDGDHPPFPWDRAREALLRPGDRVTVRCDAEVAGGSSPEVPYREPARQALISRGIPIVERQGPPTT